MKPYLKAYDKTEAVEPLAHFTVDQGHLIDKAVGVVEASDSVAGALTRNGFDARRVARYESPSTGMTVDVYQRPGSRPRQFVLAISYPGDDELGVPDMVFAPHLEAYADFVRAFELRAVEVEGWTEERGRVPGDCGARSACG